MTLGDERARVPFALVGAMLLVTSATFAATVGHRSPGGADVDVAEALDRGEAAARSALATASRRAAREAARNPVALPADTPAGRALNRSSPQLDALRVRTYLAAAEAMETAETTVGDARVSVSVPPVRNASNLSRAKRRVGLRRTAPGRLRVTLRNVTVAVRHDGRTVASRRRAVTVTVATTSLLLHERTTRFGRRLSRGATDGPGIGRRLTKRLYAIAWARGYAFYGGAPIANVVSTRHVEFAANGAMLAEQRAAFGRADPAGVDALERAGTRVGLLDVVSVLPVGPQQWTQAVLDGSPAGPVGTSAIGRPDRSFPGPDSTMRVGVNATADRAFRDLLTGSSTASLAAIRRRTYGAAAEVRTNRRHVVDGALPPRDPPGENWTLAAETVRRNATVRPGAGPVPVFQVERRYHDAFSRRVVVRTVAERTWSRDGENRTRVVRARDVYGVGVAIGVRHGPTRYAPSHPVAHVHERGGPIDGENLAGVPARVHRRFVADYGGRDAVAAAVARGEYRDRTVPLYADRPPALDRWTYASLRSLRERVRRMHVTVRAGRMATGTNGARKLLEKVRRRRADLVDAPDRYRSLADKVRVAARAAYVDRVVERLERRAAAVERSQAETDDALADAGDVPSGHLDRVLAARREVTPPLSGAVRTGSPGGPVRLRVDGAPSYLTTTPVPADRTPRGVGTVHPLVTRNRNFFTVPYGDVADGILSAFFDRDRSAPYRSAARTLRSVEASLTANRTEAGRNVTESFTYRNRYLRLGGSLEDATGDVGDAVAADLAADTRLSPDAAEATVERAFARYDTTGKRAVAVANGSMARTLAAVASRRGDTPSTTRFRDRVRVVARVSLVDARADNPIDRGTARGAATQRQRLLEAELKRTAVDAARNYTRTLQERHFGDGPRGIPAGLGVVPFPGYWYATVNVWDVDVRGEFGRFAVRSPSAGPRAVGGTVAYVRDGANVTLDVDGDGTAERLGRATRLRVDTGTTVAVVVPPGGQGVGDVDGNADERSAGWPTAGTGDRGNEVPTCAFVPYPVPCSTNSERTSTD